MLFAVLLLSCPKFLTLLFNLFAPKFFLLFYSISLAGDCGGRGRTVKDEGVPGDPRTSLREVAKVGGVQVTKAAPSQMAVAMSLSTLHLLPSLKGHSLRYHGLRHFTLLRTSNSFVILTWSRYHLDWQAVRSFNGLIIQAATEGSAQSSQSDEKIPSWARPNSDKPPPWAQDAGSGSSPELTF